MNMHDATGNTYETPAQRGYRSHAEWELKNATERMLDFLRRHLLSAPAP